MALASTSTRLRALLLPQVFHTLVLGEKERSKKCKKRLRELSKMRDVLLSVR